MTLKRASRIDRLADAKNAVRGAIANHKTSIADTIAHEFEDLEPTAASDFFGWLSGYPATLYSLHPSPKIEKYGDLTFELSGQWRDVGAIIRWVAKFLNQHQSSINRFLELSNELELAWLGDDISRAESTLDVIEHELGISIWLIQARIGFLQRCRGLEAQKQYARSIHEAAPKSLPAAVSHYISYRNEATVSLARFRQRIDRLVSRPKIPSAVRIFLQIQLAGRSLGQLSNSEIAGYLGVCSGLSIIDAYEGLLECLQTVCINPNSGIEKHVILDALTQLPKNDFRLAKIGAVVNTNFDILPNRSWTPEDWYVFGDGPCAAISFLDIYKDDPTDIDALFWCGAAYAMAGEFPEQTNLEGLPFDYLRWATAVRIKSTNLSAAISDSTKSLLNLRSLHSARAMLGYIHSELFETPAYGTSPATEQFWATRRLHPAHAIHLPHTVAERLLNECHEREPNNTMVIVYRRALLGLSVDCPANNDVVLEIKSLGSLWRKDPDGALAAASDLAKSRNGVFSRRAAQLEIHCLMLEGDTDAAIRRTAYHCCEEDELRFVLPLSEILPDGRWRDVRHLKSEIALPVTIDLAMRTTGDAKYGTNRRISYDEFLRANQCDRPSYLAHSVLRFPLPQMIYFLERICLPDVMDVSFQTFKNSRDLQNERINVCALLSQINPQNSGNYSEEIKEITRLINLQEGLRDVDKSRVHVNMEAIRSWADSELKESFQRYKVLSKLNSRFSAQGDLEQAMREAAEGERHALDSYLRYPSDEGDSLLIEIFEAVKNEVLMNPDYGLDAYLSMRIRHGSLAGHLRGPLEEKSLLLPSDSSSATKNASTTKLLIDKSLENFAGGGSTIENLPISELTSFYVSCLEFSQAYDAIIDDLAKNRLQIRRPDKPLGLFDVEALPLYIYWVRSRVHPETEFFDFFEDIVAAIEVMLTKCLVEVRRYVTQDIKAAVEGIFDKFRESTESISDPKLYSLVNSTIASAVPEVQAAIDRVADWFAYDQAQQIAALRSVDQILDIAIEATRNARRGFNPRIERQIEDLGLQSQGVLLEFTDILFTILDNVYRHSEVGEEPWVKIVVKGEQCSDDIRKRITIRVDSQIAPGVCNPAAIAKLDRIRAVMATGEYRKQVNLEGGTGLLKLKRLIARDPRQTVEFGFDGDSFFVEVNLLFVFITAEQEFTMGEQ